jgi:hypothetical protein
MKMSRGPIEAGGALIMVIFDDDAQMGISI